MLPSGCVENYCTLEFKFSLLDRSIGMGTHLVICVYGRWLWKSRRLPIHFSGPCPFNTEVGSIFAQQPPHASNECIESFSLIAA